MIFTWTSHDKTGLWKNWDWEGITHLGFFSDIDDEQFAFAKDKGVSLLQARGLPDSSQWPNATARAAWIEENVADVLGKGYSGIAFDYEGKTQSDAERDGYTALARETKAALGESGELAVCVGGTPEYEYRDYDFAGLASEGAADIIFIMGYDLIFWDDLGHCVGANATCSPADAPYPLVEQGVSEYADLVGDDAKDKLVLGLPWYGNRYIRVLGIPFNEGQTGYGDVLDVIESRAKEDPTWEDEEKTWRVKCDGACFPDDDDGNKGTEIWYDDAESLAPKYALAAKYGIGGVGMWEANHLDYDGHPQESADMWTAIVNWDQA